YRVVDQADFMEVHEQFAQNLVVGFGRLGGRTVGIVANQPMYLAGTLDINASLKGARFVRTCDCYNIPIVTFVDVTGYLPGTAQEYEERFANPYIAASRGYIDEVIDPRETRPRLIRALEMLRNKAERPPAKKHGNIPL